MQPLKKAWSCKGVLKLLGRHLLWIIEMNKQIYFLFLTILPLRTVIILLKDGGIDLTNEVLSLLEESDEIEK